MNPNPFRLRGRGLVVALAAPSLVATALVVGTAQAGAVSVVDYSQCANGQPPSVAVTCTGGWINGILQGSNSHYRESETTPQRLEVNVGSGPHSITLTYQARKGGSLDGTHAYDGLTTWNSTATGADRCSGVSGGAAVGICPPTGSVSELTIPTDPTVVGPGAALATAALTAANKVTSAHVPVGKFQMYGGTLTGATTPTHSDPVGSGDDYATTVISFTTTGPAHNVQLLFGGHLAVSPLNRGGWGPGLGASNINGGPYHIKWAAADGSSVGNRDNQIQGSSIQALAEVSLLTTPSPATYTSASAPASISDTASGLGGATGSVSFSLYGPFATAGAVSCAGNALATTSGSLSSGSATGTLSGSAVPVAPGIYQWVATYGGDSNNAGANGACPFLGEQFTVTKASPTLSTTAGAGATVGASGTVTDTANVSGGYNTTGATVTFELFGPAGAGWTAADCTSSTRVGSATGTLSAAGVASGAVAVPTTAGTYWWKATLPVDTYNFSASHACGSTGETVSIAQATPGMTTQADAAATVGTSTISDVATVTGGYNPSGTVTFSLYGPSSSADCSSTKFVTSTTATLSGGTATGTVATPTTAGTYYWVASLPTDINNAVATHLCGADNETVTVSLAQADASSTQGVTDRVTVTGTTALGTPTGDVTFKLFSGSTCAAASEVFSDTKPLTAGSATSGPSGQLATGTYYWTVDYAGDGAKYGARTVESCGIQRVTITN